MGLILTEEGHHYLFHRSHDHNPIIIIVVVVCLYRHRQPPLIGPLLLISCYRYDHRWLFVLFALVLVLVLVRTPPDLCDGWGGRQPTRTIVDSVGDDGSCMRAKAC